MKLIGKYEVRGLLGRGGMGAVYKVRMPFTGKMMALKLLAPRDALLSLMGHEEIRGLFLAEARTMGGIRHPNVAAVWDFEDSPGLTFFVMEYYCLNLGEMIGETYDLEARTRVLAVDRVVRYSRQTLRGLERLHRAGIVHRDIKPFNLLIGEDDTLKITDFGLSRLRGEKFGGPRRLKVGSPYYTAPEQERNPDDAGPEADMYSVGVTMHRLLTGLLPVDGLARPSRHNGDLTAGWDDFIQKSLAPDPGKRFSAAPDMMAALDELDEEWRRRNGEVCAIPIPEINRAAPAGPGAAPRPDGIRVTPDRAREVFGLDELWRPLEYPVRQWAAIDRETAVESASGLIWQRGGSEYPLTWEEAHEYVGELNRGRWGGRADWRLPTIDELKTILHRPARAGDFCGEPLLDPDRKWLWSSDRRSAVAAWYVNADLGYVGRQDFTCYFHARAVRTA